MAMSQSARRARSRILTGAKRKVDRQDFFKWAKDGEALINQGHYTAQEIFGIGGVPTWSTR
jgi:hypothetical protein